jgi:hypothetical protein
MRVPVRRDNVRENLNIVVDLPKDLVVSCSNRVERGCGAVANEPNRRPQVVLLAGSGLVPRQGCGRLRRLLDRWPTLELARRARRETLTDFFRAHNVRNQASIERRLEAIRIEQSLTVDPAAIVPMRLLIEALLPQLRAACAAIARFDVEIARLCPELPDYELFRALPGAGPALGPRLLVAFGERREAASASRTPPRFRSTRALRPSPNAAATNPGSTGVTLAPSFSANPSSSGSRRRSHAPSGRKPSTRAAALGASVTRPLSEPSLSSGSASSTAAAFSVSPTTSPATCLLSKSAKRRSSSLLLPPLTDDHFSIAVRLRA